MQDKQELGGKRPNSAISPSQLPADPGPALNMTLTHLRCWQAIAAHDKVMRSLMVLHHGWEVCTEGDAFLTVFREPEDACAWCMAVQQACRVLLLYAPARHAAILDARLALQLGHAGVQAVCSLAVPACAYAVGASLQLFSTITLQ